MTTATQAEPASDEIITVHAVDVEPIEQSRDSLLTKAAGLVIVTNEDLAEADQLLLEIAKAEAAAMEALRPMRESTTRAWRAGTELEKRLVGPFAEAKKALGNRRGVAYRKLQEEAEQRRRAAEAAARKDAEDRALEAAAAAEESARRATEEAAAEKQQAQALREAGRDAEADELDESARQKEQAASADTARAEAALEKPAPVPVAAATYAVRKTSGVSSRSAWKAEVVDFRALVRAAAEREELMAYLLPNESALNGVARSLKGNFRIPGCTAKEEAVTAVSAKRS